MASERSETSTSTTVPPETNEASSEAFKASEPVAAVDVSSAKGLAKMTRDARKSVLILKQAEDHIKAIRSYERLEYVDYVDKVEIKSAGKMGLLTGISSIAAFSGAVTFDFLPPSLEVLGVLAILAGGTAGMFKAYHGSGLATFLSPIAMNKARKKQSIENRVHHLFTQEKTAGEQAILTQIKPLMTELNYSLKKINREIHYSPGTGQFRLRDTRNVPLVSNYTQERMPSLSRPKWDNIYVLATTQGKELRAAYLPFRVVEVTPELLQKKNLTIEESIAILRYTEKELKKALDKTIDRAVKTTEREIGRVRSTDPSDHEYIKDENRLISKAQKALETINRAIDPSEGKLVYSSGTRFPNFNISQSSGEKKVSKWESMEQIIKETMTLGRITSLKALEIPKAPETTNTL